VYSGDGLHRRAQWQGGGEKRAHEKDLKKISIYFTILTKLLIFLKKISLIN